MDNPKIAIAVMVENAGFGAAVAAPIAKQLMMTYLMPQAVPPVNKLPIVKKDTVQKNITLLR